MLSIIMIIMLIIVVSFICNEIVIDIDGQVKYFFN